MTEFWDFLIKISSALVAGIFIGLEREFKKKDAGLKTNILVSIGACVFVLISLQFQLQSDVDVTRVLGQVVTGIGFLGAGVIIKKKDNIQGLTTAATVWCAAAVGALAAVGMFKELAAVTVLILIVNYFFGLLNKKI